MVAYSKILGHCPLSNEGEVGYIQSCSTEQCPRPDKSRPIPVKHL